MACPECRGKVDMFREWWQLCRENLRRLQQVQAEQNRFSEKQLQPDTTCDNEGRIEISLLGAAQEERTMEKPRNLITIMKVNHDESEESNIQTHLDDHIQYYYSHNIQNMPLNLVRSERQDRMNKVYQSSSFMNTLQENREEEVSPPPTPTGLNLPILIPSSTLQSKETPDDPEYEVQQQEQTHLNQEERRKHRNREASRRYREKARGDPELLKKMREQQNKRQKKYYARLKEKKMMKRCSDSPSPSTIEYFS